MSRVIIISGPVGAGKTTVARKLVSQMTGSVAYIEGDKFWSFIEKSEKPDRREHFSIIMRAMTAAAIPFARSGFDVVLDFSAPPGFLQVARKILKEVPLEFVILLPNQAICAARASARQEGKISDYSEYSNFYALFNGFEKYKVGDDSADAVTVAEQVLEGLKNGRFRVT